MESLEGRIGNPGVITAKCIVTEKGEEPKVKEDYVLITRYSSPKMAPAMFNAVGVATENGGIMSHLAVVSREMGIPCITAVDGIMDTFKTGDYVTIDANGELGKPGKVYLREK